MYYFTLLHSILFLSFNIAYVQHNQSSWLDPTCLILKGLSVAHVPGAISDFAGGHLWVCVWVHGWNVYFRWMNTIFAPAKRTKNKCMNERTTEGGNEGKKKRRHMPALMNAGIYLDFSSSPQTRAFLHQQDAVTTRETPNRLCPAHWRCPDL